MNLSLFQCNGPSAESGPEKNHACGNSEADERRGKHPHPWKSKLNGYGIGSKNNAQKDCKHPGGKRKFLIGWLCLWHGAVIFKPNPDKPVVAKRKSRFIGELKIEDLLYRFALSFQFKSIAFLLIGSGWEFFYPQRWTPGPDLDQIWMPLFQRSQRFNVTQAYSKQSRSPRRRLRARGQGRPEPLNLGYTPLGFMQR